MAKRLQTVESVTVTYNIDDALNHHYHNVGGSLMSARELMNSEKNVGDWYMDAYPDDTMGKDIRDDLTWPALLEGMRKHEDMDNILGVCDSLIRERVFARLSQLTMLPYDVFYNMWLN
jgi:hypothetical protein